MGKVLIIKGADFSQVAVAHEIVEPTVYYNVGNNIGTSGQAGYQNGDYYYRCQHGIADQVASLSAANSGLFLKQNNSADRPSGLAVGDFIKIKDAYYQVVTATYLGTFIVPYYNAIKLDFQLEEGFAYKFVDAATEPTTYSNSALGNKKINLTAGKKYVIFGIGSSSNLYTVGIIKKANNSYVNIGDGANFNFIEYTAEAGDVLWFSTSERADTWVAEIV